MWHIAHSGPHDRATHWSSGRYDLVSIQARLFVCSTVEEAVAACGTKSTGSAWSFQTSWPTLETVTPPQKWLVNAALLESLLLLCWGGGWVAAAIIHCLEEGKLFSSQSIRKLQWHKATERAWWNSLHRGTWQPEHLKHKSRLTNLYNPFVVFVISTHLMHLKTQKQLRQLPSDTASACNRASFCQMMHKIVLTNNHSKVQRT